MSKPRRRNERDWPDWEDLPGNRRRYWIRRQGREWGHQIMFKEVSLDPQTQLEETLRLWQEVYDDHGELVESHQKYPADTRHQKL